MRRRTIRPAAPSFLTRVPRDRRVSRTLRRGGDDDLPDVEGRRQRPADAPEPERGVERAVGLELHDLFSVGEDVGGLDVGGLGIEDLDLIGADQVDLADVACPGRSLEWLLTLSMMEWMDA